MRGSYLALANTPKRLPRAPSVSKAVDKRLSHLDRSSMSCFYDKLLLIRRQSLHASFLHQTSENKRCSSSVLQPGRRRCRMIFPNPASARANRSQATLVSAQAQRHTACLSLSPSPSHPPITTTSKHPIPPRHPRSTAPQLPNRAIQHNLLPPSPAIPAAPPRYCKTRIPPHSPACAAFQTR